MTKKLAPVHPGDMLLEEFLKPMGISQYRLANDIGVHPRLINEIVHGNRTITADTAFRLSRYFGLSERFWLNLQAPFDLEVEKDRLEGRRSMRSILDFQHSPTVISSRRISFTISSIRRDCPRSQAAANASGGTVGRS